MFGKKKIVNEINKWDAHMKTLYNELAEIGWEMGKRVQKAYIKSQAVAIYLNCSSDWEKACKDRDLAQQMVHCSIGAYDDKRAEILRFMEEHGEKLEQHWSTTLDSHTMIEREMEIILQKR